MEMKFTWHTSEQIVRKLREAHRLLTESTPIAKVMGHLKVSNQTHQRWRSQSRGCNLVVNHQRRTEQIDLREQIWALAVKRFPGHFKNPTRATKKISEINTFVKAKFEISRIIFSLHTIYGNNNPNLLTLNTRNNVFHYSANFFRTIFCIVYDTE